MFGRPETMGWGGERNRDKVPDPPIFERFKDPSFLPSFDEAKALTFGQRQDYQKKFDDHEVWNKEYIERLADYLVGRINELGSNDDELVILEVGAGTGRLTHFLKIAVQEKMPNADKIKFVAVDNQNRHLPNMSQIKPKFDVLDTDAEKIFHEFNPKIAIASWPSTWVDWPKAFTSSETIITIGPGDLCAGGDPYQDDGWVELTGFRKSELKDAMSVQTSKDQHANTVAYEKIQTDD